MPLPFLIETFDKADSSGLRRRLTDAHLDFLDAHRHLLLACGAKRSDDGKRVFGGIYLVDVESRQDAAAFIAADPLTGADLFDRVVILRWSKAYFDGKPALPRRRVRSAG